MNDNSNRDIVSGIIDRPTLDELIDEFEKRQIKH